jgi:hypothetical protein
LVIEDQCVANRRGDFILVMNPVISMGRAENKNEKYLPGRGKGGLLDDLFHKVGDHVT